ncbi:hypothetical protein EON65_46020 [archaeon]|nr:MAG: hypothetical protein EON65_46020 [archaeon]
MLLEDTLVCREGPELKLPRTSPLAPSPTPIAHSAEPPSPPKKPPLSNLLLRLATLGKDKGGLVVGSEGVLLCDEVCMCMCKCAFFCVCIHVCTCVCLCMQYVYCVYCVCKCHHVHDSILFMYAGVPESQLHSPLSPLAPPLLRYLGSGGRREA